MNRTELSKLLGEYSIKFYRDPKKGSCFVQFLANRPDVNNRFYISSTTERIEVSKTTEGQDLQLKIIDGPSQHQTFLVNPDGRWREIRKAAQ